MKSVEILGVKFCSGTVRDLMHAAEALLEGEGMRIIEAVSTPMLLESQENQNLQEAFNSMDMLLMGDIQLLGAAGLSTANRRTEIENHSFFREILKRLGNQRKRVFLLSEEREGLDELLGQLEKNRVPIAGKFAMAELAGDPEGAVNQMNAAAPDVILSMLSTPFAEEFLMEQRSKLDAELWYGIGQYPPAGEVRMGLIDRLREMVHRQRLRKSIHEYDEVEQEHEGR